MGRNRRDEDRRAIQQFVFSHDRTVYRTDADYYECRPITGDIFLYVKQKDKCFITKN